jgi:hypothetical protein
VLDGETVHNAFFDRRHMKVRFFTRHGHTADARVYPGCKPIEDAVPNGSKVISINAESSGSFGAEDSELVGTASVLLPQLLEGLSLDAPR